LCLQGAGQLCLRSSYTHVVSTDCSTRCSAASCTCCMSGPTCAAACLAAACVCGYLPCPACRPGTGMQVRVCNQAGALRAGLQVGGGARGGGKGGTAAAADHSALLQSALPAEATCQRTSAVQCSIAVYAVQRMRNEVGPLVRRLSCYTDTRRCANAVVCMLLDTAASSHTPHGLVIGCA
jgi:hypothetical protein